MLQFLHRRDPTIAYQPPSLCFLAETFGSLLVAERKSSYQSTSINGSFLTILLS